MATSKDLSHYVLNASEEVVDNPCAFCFTRDNTDIESVYFCIDCDSYICRSCKNWHADIPLMKDHQVVGISQAASGRQQNAPLPTHRCHEHHGQIIDKFCLDHDALACDSCVSMYHRACKRVEYILLIATGTKKGKESQVIIKSAQSLLKTFKNMKYSRQDTLQQLDTAKRQSQQAVQDQRDDLVKWIDGLAKSDLATIKSNFHGKTSVVKKEMQYVDDQINATESILKDLNGFKGENQSELFVYIKQGEKAEKDGKQLVQTLQQYRTTIPTYKPHTSIQKSMSNIKSLGELEDESVSDSLKSVSLRLRGEHNIKCKTTGDKSRCDVLGACSLPDGSYILADYDNKSLKHMESTNKVTASLDMSSAPSDVCFTNNNNEVAVTLPTKKIIQFAIVGSSMKKTRSFSTDDVCRGIAFSDGELFVGCGSVKNTTGGNVRVYNLSGAHLRTIQFDTAGQRLFSIIGYVTVSSCGRKLHVTDRDRGIITTDRQGNLLATFSDPDLKFAAGVCTLDTGGLLVCGRDSSNVMHVSRDGRKLGVVLGKQDGIVKPLSLSYDSVKYRLLVTTSRSDTIKVYDVHVE